MAPRQLKARALAQSERLITRNVGNLYWTTLQNINDSFRRFAARLDDDLREAIAATHGAILAAQDKRRIGAEQMNDEIARLRAMRNELLVLTAAFAERAAE